MKPTLFCACALSAAFVHAAAESDAFRLIPTPHSTVYWQGIRTPSVSIPVEVPSYATSAELTISNLTGTVVAHETLSSTGAYDWTVFTGSAPEGDDLFTLTLVTRLDSKVMKTETATLALVRNAFAPVVLPAKTTVGWGDAGDNLVLPYSDRWGSGTLSASLSCQGEVEEVAGLSGEGWFGRALAKTAWRRHPVEASFTQGETTWTATVRRRVKGLAIIVR